MSAGASRRRRQILRTGRPIVLSRADLSASVTVTGYAPPPQASQLAEGVGKATLLAQITADETSRTGYEPRKGDNLRDGPKTYTLTDASPVFDRGTLCGWTLIASGGS
ncbi:hypothetical protein [Swaminathania salitolerans]|uniref:Uncharacterized protein n=1 Tax=Swaminathania salitolerans TaxID=182838 RepID=A0A511BPU3_9PROT|nr:hypothetical protein [Swaminathania salitolerans]GBQ14743.1 hypothetical protein AA21291_1942 [Swaminathania salitolerans LMG 21291]GEL01873.1 hypothetical protein SSA02_10360 [Swaminathania salitolerans]